VFTGPILLFVFFFFCLSIFFRLFDFDPFRNSGRVKVYAEFESLRVGKTTILDGKFCGTESNNSYLWDYFKGDKY
jgi:hypothetical protein